MEYKVTEASTVSGIRTPHGFKTPHKFPTTGKISLTSLLSELATQLYPTGKAFYTIKRSVKDNLHITFNRSLVRLLNDSQSTIDSVFPDNKNFSAEDCSLWEYRFGIVTNTNLNITLRRLAIFRRMGRGRNVPARQHKNYIEYQLQTAGFDVYVHENGFIEGGVKVYKKPQDVINIVGNNVEHGDLLQHGIGVQHGISQSRVIANSYKPNEPYSVGDNRLWATFFIGGAVLGNMAAIPASREEEFRELVLKLKPAHLVAFTFINYI